MAESTQLQAIRQMMHQGKYTEVYGACLEELKAGVLPRNELQAIGVLSICSVIKIIPLDDFYKENVFDEDLGYEVPMYKDEYEEVVEIFSEQIMYLRKLVDRRDGDTLRRMAEVVAEYIYGMFAESLDPIVGQIRDAQTYRCYTSLYQGFVSLCCWVLLKFATLADCLRIGDFTFPKVMARGQLLVADKFIDQAYNLDQEIKELSYDFPYFAADDAKTVCLYAVTQAQLLHVAIKNIEEEDPENVKKLVLAKKNLITYYSNALNSIMVVNGKQHSALPTKERRTEYFNEILELEKEIRQVEPGYTRPDASADIYKAGCYIATAVYGSYDCPQVWVLRRYRDEKLAGSVFGRMFIKAYYAVSPTLVKWFGETAWFKRIWKALLDRKIRGLKEQGVQDAPYRDREW